MDSFEEFWKACPDRGSKGKGGKDAARKKYTEIANKIGHSTLMKAANHWRLQNVNVPREKRGLIPMVSTWLNQGYWETALEEVEGREKPVLKPVSKQHGRVSQYDAMNSKVGRYALANGQGANFWLAVDRINYRHDRAECRDARDFINDKGGVATRYIQKQINARESMRSGSLRPKGSDEWLSEERKIEKEAVIASLRKSYQASIERERSFAEKYGG